MKRIWKHFIGWVFVMQAILAIFTVVYGIYLQVRMLSGRLFPGFMVCIPWIMGNVCFSDPVCGSMHTREYTL